jgi:predicted ATPase
MVWCSSDAISEAEYRQRELKDFSRFIYPLQNAKPDELEGALSTIAEHHPNETIWVESRAEA